MLKRIVLGLLALVGLAVIGLAANALRQGSRQVDVPPLAPLALDVPAIAASLGAAVRARTISLEEGGAQAAPAFEALHAHLRARYPLVFAQLAPEVIGGHSLLFTWQGSEPGAKPIGLMAHQDVVPIAPGTEGDWQQPPFSGAIEGGFVWGRGAWDDKGNLIAELEAIERLLADGFKPRRTVYLMFGHDEEIGGQQGAAQIAALLQQRGIKLDFVLDEGLLIISGVLPGLAVPAAAIGIAEKGYLTVKLSVPAATGHSSMPPPPGQSAIAVLAAALARVDAQPMPGGIKGVARQMLETVAPEMSWQYRIAMSNLWLFGPLIEPVLARSPSTNALIRTTTALTVFSAGNKENVLPGRAEATINFRLLPGDAQDKVLDHLRRAVSDPRVKIEPEPGASEASRVASTESGAYRLVQRTLREVFPDAVVVPGLMVGATDSGHFASVADQILRFSPVRANAEDLKRFHGTNERIALNNLADMVRFYHRLVQQAAR